MKVRIGSRYSKGRQVPFRCEHYLQGYVQIVGQISKVGKTEQVIIELLA